MGIQRAVLDFCAETPYAKVQQRMTEHYGIKLPAGAAARIACGHLHSITDEMALRLEMANSHSTTILEIDGGMVPIMTPHENDGDKRKGKTLSWNEFKLCSARGHDMSTPYFAGTIGSPKTCGEAMAKLVSKVGGAHSSIHALGDGAPWIAEQVELQWGSRAHYLVDWFHLAEYLSQASASFGKEQAQPWLDKAKEDMLHGRVEAVLSSLRPHRERAAQTGSKKVTPVLNCWRYIKNRLGQFDYKQALEKSLPIGSGEIESSHRYVVQARLKKSGAWWRSDSAQAMIRLRMMRHNGRWEEYWCKKLQGNFLMKSLSL
jgi:hypothetical protein